MLRAVIISALDALEVGDVPTAVEILLSALEGDDEKPRQLRWHTCSLCPAAYRWPGELDHHQRFAHGFEAAA